MSQKLWHLYIDPQRVFGLDLLRALAILFVVASHGTSLMPKLLHQVMDHIILDGVSIFFVLSGFLIGGILLRTFERHGVTVRVAIDFWIRRWFRTLPTY